MLILIVLKESMHLIKTVKCNCYYGISSNVNEREVYNGEVYSDDDDEDEDDEVYNDVQDGISNSAQ